MKYLFKNNNISIRKMEDNIADYKLMTKWLSTDELLDYYEGRNNSFDLDKVIKKFTPRVKGEEEYTPCFIEYKEKPIGYIQYYVVDASEYNTGDNANIKSYSWPYAVDLFIGEIDNWSKGIGTLVMKSMISYLFTNENAEVIFIDPQTWNKRAIRCYEKSGFIPRGIIKNRELHDGEYKDSLIMSVLFEDWEWGL